MGWTKDDWKHFLKVAGGMLLAFADIYLILLVG